MGWLVGAVMQKRRLGVAGFLLIVASIFMPWPGVRGSLLALGAVLIVASGVIAGRAHARARRQVPSPDLRLTWRGRKISPPGPGSNSDSGDRP